VKGALAILLAQTAATWYSAGFIWTMQVLNYPLLSRVGLASFSTYETAHNQRFAAVVGPGVVIAFVTTIALFIWRSPAVPVWAPIVCAGLVVVILASTVIWQAPAHARLAGGFDEAVHARLVQTNWVRTVAWTALGLLDLWMLYATFEERLK
jgi:hypothetical protein